MRAGRSRSGLTRLVAVVTGLAAPFGIAVAAGHAAEPTTSGAASDPAAEPPPPPPRESGSPEVAAPDASARETPPALGASDAQGDTATMGSAPEGTRAALAARSPDDELSGIVVAHPRFAIAAAMGLSIDNAGIADHRNVLIPSFLVQGGIGQGVLGFEARLFASEAAGRFSTPSQIAADRNVPIADVGADRQAVDLMLAVRPFAAGRMGALAWPARFARALTLDVGVGGERVSVGSQTLFRGGAVVGGYVDIPVTPANDTSTLSLRFAARRMFGTHGSVSVSGQSLAVSDTKVELFGGLAVAF